MRKEYKSTDDVKILFNVDFRKSMKDEINDVIGTTYNSQQYLTENGLYGDTTVLPDGSYFARFDMRGTIYQAKIMNVDRFCVEFKTNIQQFVSASSNAYNYGGRIALGNVVIDDTKDIMLENLASIGNKTSSDARYIDYNHDTIISISVHNKGNGNFDIEYHNDRYPNAQASFQFTGKTNIFSGYITIFPRWYTKYSHLQTKGVIEYLKIYELA